MLASKRSGATRSDSSYHEEFKSTFEAMIGVLDRAVSFLVARGWVTAGQEPCTRLCLEEALVNAIRHGNHCDEKRKVALTIEEQGDLCIIRIKDEGAGFNPESVELPDCDTLGGRGICLIRHYMEYVKFNQKEHCLEMAFKRQCACGNGGEANGRC